MGSKSLIVQEYGLISPENPKNHTKGLNTPRESGFLEILTFWNLVHWVDFEHSNKNLKILALICPLKKPFFLLMHLKILRTLILLSSRFFSQNKNRWKKNGHRKSSRTFEIFLEAKNHSVRSTSFLVKIFQNFQNLPKWPPT